MRAGNEEEKQLDESDARENLSILLPRADWRLSSEIESSLRDDLWVEIYF